MKTLTKTLITLVAALILTTTMFAPPAHARTGKQAGTAEALQKTTEAQIRNMVEPILDKYCRDECKLMSVNAQIDFATPDQVAPGFDDIDPRSVNDIAASSAKVKLLIDEKVGPISRGKLLDLVQQYLDTLDFPVKVETQISRFPQPIGSSAKVAELREQITKQFKNTLDTLFHSFCPEHCLLADYDLKTEVVNPEEAQYGSMGEFVEDGGIALKIKNIDATVLVDDSLTPEEQQNILEMARLKTNFFRNVTLTAKALKFPHPILADSADGADSLDASGRRRGLSSSSRSKDSKTETESKNSANNSQTLDQKKSESTDKSVHNTDSKNLSSNNEKNEKQERFERFEKIERVESGDAVQAELQKFKVYGLVFACSVLSLLLFIALSTLRPGRRKSGSALGDVLHRFKNDPALAGEGQLSHGDAAAAGANGESRAETVAKRYEIQRMTDELMKIFAEQPRVAKQVFTRILSDEGVEITAQYLDLFGESVVMDMLRDPSLQNELNELMEFYAKNTFDLTDDEKVDLLRRLHNRTVAGKLVVMGRRSSNLFDFLIDMDGQQIMELVRNESLTVKSIVLTQCDPQKRASIYSQMDEASRMQTLAELSRIDYLPRDYVFNVANALKRKRTENPRLNTEALPGSDVLLTLLERSTQETQGVVMRNLELNNPESARHVKSKLVCLSTLRFLRDGQLLEVVLSLKHDELIQFLKGAPPEVRNSIFSKSPRDLVAELQEELSSAQPVSREGYQNIERKVVHRIRTMANEGIINLVEANERMFAAATVNAGAKWGPSAPTFRGAASTGTSTQTMASTTSTNMTGAGAIQRPIEAGLPPTTQMDNRLEAHRERTGTMTRTVRKVAGW